MPDEILGRCPSGLETVEVVELEMFAYFVVSGGKGGNTTFDVGVSTTAALLVIVRVAALLVIVTVASLVFVSEPCLFGFSTLFST